MQPQTAPNIIKREAFIIRPVFSGGLKEKKIFGDETLKSGPELQNMHIDNISQTMGFPEYYRLMQNADVK